MAYAWRCFLFDTVTSNPLGLSYGTGSRPPTGGGAGGGGAGNDRGSAKKGAKKRDQPSDSKIEYWKSRDATLDEHIAAVKVQKSFRGYRCRKIKAGRTPGTEDNLKAWELLQKSWVAMEPNMDQIGLVLFRTMFKSDPDLMPKYPFYKDEWNKITYTDYQGNHPDQPPHTWFVVFREIFYVHEEMLCVPKLYSPISTCMLRVVNNDTGEEIPKVFQKVAPYVYKKNKAGYTFVAEARTTDVAQQPGKWRMRLIGSLSQLPAPDRTEIMASFHSRDIRDYYIPNERNCIFRYTARACDDHLVSLQVNTSKPDVYIKLQVLDQEQEIMSAVGKGHVVIPACIFQRDPDVEQKRAESRASNPDGKKKGAKAADEKGVKIAIRRTGSAASVKSSGHRSGYSTDDEDEREGKSHKYIIQATVLRGSWPLSESQWAFALQLKELEKEEIKAHYNPVSQKERPLTPAKDVKAADKAKAKDKAKGKGAKDKDKDKSKDGSRPPSQQFDSTKSNWTLRIVSDGPLADDLEVKKDTERADEIRAMKKAWEDAEPGRAAKALQSRLQYLNKHMIKLVPDEDEDAAKEGSATKELLGAVSEQSATERTLSPNPVVGLDAAELDTQLSNDPPPPPPPKEMLEPIDLDPFIRHTMEVPRLLDEEEAAAKEEQKRAEIQQYRAAREEIERERELDRQERNLIKRTRIELFESLQVRTDNFREEINEPREAFRQKYLEAERLRLEAIAAQEEAMRQEMEKNSPQVKSAKGGKKSAGKKKK